MTDENDEHYMFGVAYIQFFMNYIVDMIYNQIINIFKKKPSKLYKNLNAHTMNNNFMYFFKARVIVYTIL